MDKCCARDIAIVCDFDGTISVEDVNRAVSKHFGGEKTKVIMEKYKKSEIGLRESLQTQYEIMQVNEKAFENYVMSNMEIDATFFDLYDFTKRNGIELAIVSGGFINYIKLLFEKHGRDLDKMGIQIYSNKLINKGEVMVTEYGNTPDCHKHFGPCGLCKYQHILGYKKKYKVIYVGDGFTDRCAAESADIVFAKDSLVKYCVDNNIEYIKYDSFKDIMNYMLNHILIQEISE